MKKEIKKIQIINGPNLNMLGSREEEIYGSMSLKELENYTDERIKLSDPCRAALINLDWWQSNSESEIIEKIHSLTKGNYANCDALVINPAAYSHTSVAILDALKVLKIPVVEVHLSNVYSRESFRQTLLTAKASSIIMSGLGKNAYYYGVLSLLEK